MMSIMKCTKNVGLFAVLMTTGGSCLAQSTNGLSSLAASAGISLESAVGIGVKSVYGVLIFLSVLALAIVLYFLVALRKGQIVPASLRRELKEKMEAGDLTEARRLCRFRSSPLSSVMLAGLDHLHEVPEEDPMLLRDLVEAEGARQSETLQGQIQYLMDVAVVAPMLGLLGTVFGMMLAFNSVAGDVAMVRPTELVGGVNKAMTTTAVGLIVGIPAMMFFAFFRRRSARMVALLEMASAELFTALMRGRNLK